MKLHAGTNNIERSGDFEESQFSIEASAKAFFILSDGLYSNKILAVVRELSTNAYDSHVDAGKSDVPFDVHLPNRLEPTFYIRDYGTSMSHESCMQLYTTYFRSTRNNSNDAVGCLGLGSKAPFAYCDSFTVEAYLDGERRLYTAYKNEDGSPVFSLMDTSETTEPNGIKVSINVSEYDVGRFNVEARKVYEFFKVRPNFISEPIHYSTPEKIIEGNNWYFDGHSDDNLIIMGQIAYPVDSNQIIIADDKASSKNSKFIDYSNGLRLFVNIGDVDITPSRESLSYSSQTKININNFISQILNDISVKIQNEIKEQPSLFKARKKYVQIADKCHSIKNAMESLQKSIIWNEQNLFDKLGTETVHIPKDMHVKLFEKSGYRSKIEVRTDIERINFNNKNVIVIDDLPRGGISRTKQYMKDTGGTSYGYYCYYYKLNNGETVDNCEFYNTLGGATKEDVVFTSSMPKIVYNRSGGGSSDGLPAVQIQVYNEESGMFEECPMSVKYENAFYFTESKGNVKLGHKNVSISDMIDVMKYMHEHYNDITEGKTFYLVKPSVAINRKLEQRDNWHSGYNLVVSVFNDAINKNYENIVEYRNKESLCNNYNHSKWIEVITKTKNDSVVKNLIFEYNEYASRIDKIASEVTLLIGMINYIPGVQIKFTNNEPKYNFSERFEKAMEKYPILKVIKNVPWCDDEQQIVADYIDSVEQMG